MYKFNSISFKISQFSNYNYINDVNRIIFKKKKFNLFILFTDIFIIYTHGIFKNKYKY